MRLTDSRGESNASLDERDADDVCVVRSGRSRGACPGEADNDDVDDDDTAESDDDRSTPEPSLGSTAE